MGIQVIRTDTGNLTNQTPEMTKFQPAMTINKGGAKVSRAVHYNSCDTEKR
jgi:hypothetical protein